ncbi:MAG: hypothetical protein HY710_03640 [Candidatus Latescibacteria bacterium]|nr:hypothetical protein [Candidatus Latescibacterota bacterium]
MRTFHLFQFGKGNIGVALIAQMIHQQQALETQYGVRLEYVGVCGRERATIDPNGLNRALELSNGRIDSIVTLHPKSRVHHGFRWLIDEVQRLDIPDLLVIDLTASELTPLHLMCLQQGIPVVTANKKPVSDDYEVYAELQRLGRSGKQLYWYEATVGAGLPVISTLREIVVTGDAVVEIIGCLSGTLGYICSQLDTGRRFSEIVREAKARGYTEPDPRDDLSGMDVARKALILAREIGSTLNLADVHVESMISDVLAQTGTAEEFMKRIRLEDDSYEARVEDSRRRGEVLRYVATVHDGRCEVGLRSVLKDSPAGNLSGPDNLLAFRTARYSDNLLVIRGPGAGAQVTAAGVFGDILKAAGVR